MNIVHDMLVALLIFLAGALATAWTWFVQEHKALEDAVLGPLGALALAMIVIFGLLKYLNAERKEARQQIDKRISDKDATINRLREENSRLWQEIHALKDEIRRK